MAPEAIEVRRLSDYMSKLEAAKVVLDADRRKDIIDADAKNAAMALGLELVEDAGLLEEVAGLNEWPTVLIGSYDESFLALPDEVTQLTIKVNQKNFVLRDPATSRLTNKFALTANIVAKDGGTKIIAGNEKVVSARLADAKFFWETDLKTKLESNVSKLQDIVFHEKLVLLRRALIVLSVLLLKSPRLLVLMLSKPSARRVWRKPILCQQWSLSSLSFRA